MPDFVTVGIIKRTRGNRGEVVVKALTDFPERLMEPESSFWLLKNGGRKAAKLIEGRRYKDNMVLKFSGFDSIGEAEELVGGEIQIEERELIELPEDRYYQHDLIGLRIVDAEGIPFGRVKGVLESGGADLLEAEKDGGDYLIPLVHRFVKDIDLSSGTVTVKDIEELIGLNES